MSEKIKHLFLLTLFFHYSWLGAMEKQITTPYEGSIAAQHPALTKTIKSLVVGLSAAAVTYCGQKLLNIEPNAKFTGSVGAFSSLAYYFSNQNKPDLVDALLYDQQTALNYAQKIKRKLEKDGAEKKLNDPINAATAHRQIKELAQKYERDCPFFLLSECSQFGCYPCPLSRTYQPKYRNTFETKAVSLLLTQLNVNQRQTNYTSFASGWGFQDLVILTKTLAKKPDANLAIHLIDIHNTKYVNFTESLNRRQITKDFNVDVTPLMEQNSKIDINLLNDIRKNYISLEIANKQILSWLTKTFPNAQITLHIHENAQGYLNFLNKHNMEYPDVVATADIQDQVSLDNQAISDYKNLCVQTLQKKPTSDNVWLAHNTYKTASIITMNMKETSDAEEQEIKLNNGEKTKIYEKNSKI